jgi:hypothetical protein
MSLSRSTMSTRKLVLLVVCLAAGVIAGFSAALAQGPGSEAASTQRPATPEPSAPGEAADPAGAAEARAADPDEAEAPWAEDGVHVAELSGEAAWLEDDDLADAGQVAADFAGQYATYSWDEAQGQALERVRPFVTAELAAELGRNSGAVAGAAQLAHREQSAAAAVETVQTDSVGEGWVDLLVVLRQELTWKGGADTRWDSYLLRVVPQEDGWRVSGLLP